MSTTAQKQQLRSWLFLLLSACAIAPVSESVHGVLLERVGIPHPNAPTLPNGVRLLDAAVRLTAVAFFVRFWLPEKWRWRPIASAVLGGLLMVMINETFRVIFIESAIVQSLPAALLDALPKLLIPCAAAMVVFVSAPRVRWPVTALSIVILSIVYVFYARPWFNGHLALWNRTYFPDVMAHYGIPYPAFLQFRILAGFLEPTAATFVLLFLCWNRLPSTLLLRTSCFTTFFVALRGNLTSFLLFSSWDKQPFPMNFLAQGQFFLETATLAVLSCLAWHYNRGRSGG